MTTIIHYKGNTIGLATLLVGLQSQLHPKDDIYVVDSSKDRSGAKIALLYGTTRCYIFVEVGNYTTEQAKKFGVQSAIENKQEGILMISDRCVISRTFISNLKKAIEFDYAYLCPEVRVLPYPKMDTNFQWFNPTTLKVKEVKSKQNYCYYETLTPKNKKTAIFENEVCVVLPDTSASTLLQ
jgi:hypothetical protein